MKPRTWTASVTALCLVASGGAAFARYREASQRAALTLPPSVIEVRRATSSGAAGSRSFIGVVLASESVEVATRLSGRVQEVSVRLGSRVAQGERIALLDTRSLRRELAVASAQLDAMKLEIDKRGLELSEAKQRLERRRAGAQLAVPTVSGEELNTAEFRGQQAALDLQLAHARVAEQQARIEVLRQQLEDSELRAPFDGVVAARYVDPGAVVTSDTPIVRLLGRGQVRLRFAVPEQVAARFVAGMRAAVEIEGTDGPFEAVIERCAPEVDTAARLVFVEARLQDPLEPQSGALSGRIARVRELAPPTAARDTAAAPVPG